MARFEVHIVPGSSRTGPDGMRDGIPRLRVKAPPADGRANAEAERMLTGLLGTTVRLARGARARRKLFDVEMPKPELDGLLRGIFDGV